MSLAALELHRLHLLASPALHPAAQPEYSNTPYALLAAVVFWAVKLLYGLDEHQQKTVAQGTAPSGGHPPQGPRAAAAVAAAAAVPLGGPVAAEVALPRVAGAPPLALPPGGWPAWARERMGAGRQRLANCEVPLTGEEVRRHCSNAYRCTWRLFIDHLWCCSA